ncbi:hypothetical protein CHS0354_029329 [Potamilus streckersoni]|uniref:Exonuclease domain-containing protein n=1 Tax=Potamilus streckersoni TaxID=2493646 RepID=A0AAE0T2F8_9BIVA|nr:hypothetical protein CHS0354_029329 [Potamilus streckersoni]
MFTLRCIFARNFRFRPHSSSIFAFKRAMSVESEAKMPRYETDMKDRIIWVDLEMSGLDIDKEHILEMACLVTDKDLNIIAEAPDLIIHQPKEVIDNMGEWCQEHHGQSGLTEAVRKSKISLQEAERQMLEFVKHHTLPGKSPLAGNSVSVDRHFLMKHMPSFTQHLHYRIVDVSTIKELCTRWYPEEFKKAPKKKKSHRALDDIKESIEELKYYRKTVFKEE